MKVYRAIAYGFESTGFIIVANNIEQALKIARDANMGSVDYDDVWELPSLSTTQTMAGILEQF